MGGNVAKFYRALQKGNEVHAMAIYVSASKEMRNYDPNQFYGKCSHGNTPMHYAAKYAMKELLEKFLYIGAIRGDPEFPNLEGKNCFHLVCTKLPRSCYNEQTVSHGVSNSPHPDGSVSKVEARRRADCLEILLNWKNPVDGSPPDLFMQDNHGNTALHLAVQSGLVDCVRLLRNAGAPLFIENKDKKTACDLCDKQAHLAHIARFLESAMVFNCQQDSQPVCVAEINALRTEIFEYETKGHESTKDRAASSSLGASTNSSTCEVFNRSASTLSMNKASSSDSSGTPANGSTNGSGSAAIQMSCWSRCSFTHQGLLNLRKEILLNTANELQISLDEAEVLLSSSFWAKDIALSNYADMKDRQSVRSRKESASTNSSYHTPTITSVSASRSQSHTTNGAITTHFFSLNESPSSYSSLSDPGSRTKSRTDSNVSGTGHLVAAEVHNNIGTTISINSSNGDASSFDQTVVIESLMESAGDNNSAVFRGTFEPDCEICMVPVDLSEPCNNVIQLTCNHCVCYCCWVDYTKMQVSKDRKCNIECPVYECDQIISSLKVEKLIRSFTEFDASQNKVDQVSSDVSMLLTLLDENRIERFVEVLESVRWCPMPDCSLAVKLPKFLSKRPCVNYFYSLKAEPLSTPIDNGTNNATDILRVQSSLGSMNVVPQHRQNGSVHISSRRATRNGARARSGRREVTKLEKEPELQVIPEDQISSVSVLCANEHYFCWNCRNEGHQPASCDHWNSWFRKIEEVKPNQMGTKDIWESAEYAANYLWFVTQSKKCPKCTAPIQKIDGCNHMKCVAKGCRHEFCWVCLTPWSKHGSATGGFWRCNRFTNTNTTGIPGDQVTRAQDTSPSTSTDNTQNTSSPPQENTVAQSTTDTDRASEAQTSSSAAHNESSSGISSSGAKVTPVVISRRGVSRINGHGGTTTTTTTETTTSEQSSNGAVRTRKQSRKQPGPLCGVSEENRTAETNLPQNQSNPARRRTEATSSANQSAPINRSGREAAARLNDLHRFLHYYARFFNHRLSMKLELPLLEQARERISSLLRCFEGSACSQPVRKIEDMKSSKTEELSKKKYKNMENSCHISGEGDGDEGGEEEENEGESVERQKRLTFLETAIKELILTRKVLSASYVFAYYLSDSHHQNVRSLFEFIQNDLEETVENLAQIVNKQHLSAPWFLVEKAQLIVKKKRYELLDATTRGILPSDTSPIFKRKRKTFQGVQVCLDPLKMNMSERQAVMTSLYEMVVEGDGWLVDSTGCHNNIPMLYGHEDYYDLDINGGPLLHNSGPPPSASTAAGADRQNTAVTSLSKVATTQIGKNKKSWPITESEAAKQCARKGCNRRVSLPAKLTNKRKNGVIGGWLCRQKLSDPTHQLPYRNLYDNKQNIANSFCSLSCMRRDKLDSLESSGFTVTGQKSSNVNLSSTSVQMSLDSEFPPVFLDNEKIDRKRREIVKMNYQQQELENEQVEQVEEVSRKIPQDSAASLSSILNNEVDLSIKVTMPQNANETVFEVEQIKIDDTPHLRALNIDNGRILHQCSSSAA